MKNFMLIAALVCSVASTYAFNTEVPAKIDDDLIINVDQLDNKQFILHIANLQQQITNIKIQDLEGNIYYREKVKDHNGFAKKIDLKELPEGRYVLSITQNDRRFSQVVLVDSDNLLFSRIKESDRF